MLSRCCIAALLSLGAFAQTFEVASIKPNAENDNRVMMRVQPGGRFVATGVSLRALIGMAFGVRDFQISGGPGWVGSDRYDINAKAESAEERIPPEQLRPMMRALLEERFKLKVREESKEMPVYALVVGKNGPKLTKAASESPGPNIRMGRGQIDGKGMTMQALAQQISQHLGRDVIDKSELTGRYDITLNWTPQPGEGGRMMMHGPPPPDGLPQVDTSGPTLFTALQEQLGLRLESTKGPVPVIVIESVEKPSEN